MRVLQAAAAASFVLLLLAWLPLRTVSTDAASFDRMLAMLDRFAVLENALDRDALSARAGMLRNYDPLVAEERGLDDLISQLKVAATDRPDEAAAIDALAKLIDRQTALIEQFKSNNALLQNSLAYFQFFSSQLGTSDDAATVSAVMALDSAMLQLTLDTSPAAAQAVADRLDRLSALSPPDKQADSRGGLLTHGGLLHALLPQTDSVLKSLYAVPIKTELENLRSIVLAHQAVSRMWAERLRFLLYATSLVLFGFLIYLAWKLRGRARALRERAAFEHLIAGMSLRFLNTPPQEIDARIEQSLAELARNFGADRAYFLQVGKAVRTHVWCAAHASLPAGWPGGVPALAAAIDATDTGVIHVPQANRLPPAPTRDALAAAGVVGWMCMANTDSDGVRRVLGFDALGRGRITEAADLGFAHMALDVLSNAAEKQALEQEKTRLGTRLQQARRMETIGALASGIAHNFNNLIGAILGYTEMAETEAVAYSRTARNLSEIRKAGDRARDLVDQILAFGRPRHKQRTDIVVDALVAEAASLLRASLPEQIRVVVVPGPGGTVVSGEIAQLQQVILNLGSNAAQAMAKAGRIEIATALSEVTGTLPLDHGELSAGRYVCLSVSDTGRGMTEDVVNRIFEPFYTRRQAGNGLGLATVKEIVIEHGGAIKVRSTPNVGSRFEVWLPCVTPARTAAPTSSPDHPADHPEPGRLQTVLLSDDDRERLFRDEEILAAIGYEPVGFTRPVDALAACRSTPERFDVLVVGQTAPAQAVLTFAAALHEQAPDLPILLATAAADAMEPSDLAAAGIREVVSRPLDPAEIAAALRRCLAAAAPAEELRP